MLSMVQNDAVLYTQGGPVKLAQTVSILVSHCFQIARPVTYFYPSCFKLQFGSQNMLHVYITIKKNP